MPRFVYMTPDEQAVSIGEAARRLGVSVDSVRRWEEEGKITSTRTPGGQRRFTPAEIERVLAGNDNTEDVPA